MALLVYKDWKLKETPRTCFRPVFSPARGGVGLDWDDKPGVCDLRQKLPAVYKQCF